MDKAVPLRRARLARCLSQTELAERAGVSPATVSYCERGATPSPRIQRALAGALNVSPQHLWPVGGDRS